MTEFRQKNNGRALKVISSNEQVADNKWMFIGTSMAVLCIAVAIAIGIVWLTSKGKIKGKGYIIFILNQI